MQKLRFESPAGEIILSDRAPYLLSNLDLGAVGKVKTTVRRQGQHGVSLQNQQLGPRLIRARCVLLCEDEKNLFYHRRVLGRGLNPGVEGILYYDNGFKEYKIAAGVDGAVTYENWLGNRRGQYFNVEFYCPSPFFTDILDRGREFVEAAPKFRFPWIVKPGFAMSTLTGGEVTLHNNGDGPCACKITFSGPAENPVIVNKTTGEYIDIRYSLTAGQKAEVTTYFGNKRVTIFNADGTEENGLHYVSAGSAFFWLAPGDNLIKFSTQSGHALAKAGVYFSPGYFIV